MVMENKELTAKAREALEGNWTLAVGTFFVYLLVTGIIGLIPMASLIIGGPMSVGISIFSLSLARKEEAELNQIFEGFKNFGTALITYFLVLLFITLWSLLLIIPGIIAALSYSQVFFILAEDNSIGAMDAIKKSKKMMYGYKWKYFLLSLRFLGWAIVCLLTLGIGFLWLAPYAEVSYANFYDDIKKNSLVIE